MKKIKCVKKNACLSEKFMAKSLTGKMLKDLLSGLAVSIYLMILLYFGGVNMLQMYFSVYYREEAELIKELGEYVRQN